MKSKLLRGTAIALFASALFAPGMALAGKGGTPAEPAQVNGRGADHAHPGKADPQPNHGNDSAPASDAGESAGGDTATDSGTDTGTDTGNPYQEYQDATVEEEGEYDEEGAEQ